MSPGPESRMRILFRHYGGDNTKPRPTYYSKMLALASLLRAIEALDHQPELVFINDQVRPGPILSLMEATGEVVPVKGGSDSKSYRVMLKREAARPSPADQFLWFSEDDYLYRPDALRHLDAATQTLSQADYLTMYGSRALDPSSGRRPTMPAHSGAGDGRSATTIDGVMWYLAGASTSTFGTRLGTLREDLDILRLCAVSGGAWDRTTSFALGGFHPFSAAELRADLLPGRSVPLSDWPRTLGRGGLHLAIAGRAMRRTSHRRQLFAADPELISHMEVDQPGVRTRTAPSARSAATNWAAIAEETAMWAQQRGIPVGPLVAS